MISARRVFMAEENGKILLKFKKQGDGNLTFYEFNSCLNKIEKAIDKVNKEANGNTPYSRNDLSPEIISVNDGCIEILISIAVAVAAGLVEHYIEKFLESIGNKFQQIKIRKDRPIPAAEITVSGTWSYDEDYEVCNEIIKTYVINKSPMDVKTFMERLKLAISAHGEKSARCKIRNTKHLLEKYNVGNTLKCSPLPNRSKRNEIIFVNLCKRYGIL